MKTLFYRVIYNKYINFILRYINKFFYPVLPKKIKIPPSGTVKVKINSKKLIFATNQTNYITNLLFWEGYKNFEYTDIFLSLIKNVDSFFDIGANIGYYSLIAAITNPEISVYSFEPAEGPFHYLKINIERNNLINIKAEKIAISEKTGEIEFFETYSKKYKYIKYNLGGESNAAHEKHHKNFKKSVVKTETLDNYFKKSEATSIDLIKLDTEGTEPLILSESTEVINLMKPIIICETLFNTTEEELETILKPFDYEFYNHTENGLKLVETIKRTQDNGARNCFFVHPSKKHLIEKFIVS